MKRVVPPPHSSFFLLLLLLLALSPVGRPNSLDSQPSIHEIEPTSGPTSGRTNVSVSGSGFSLDIPTQCLFGDMSVTAQVITSTLLTCTSPVAYSQSVNFTLFLGNSTEVDSGLKYLYYTDVVIHSIRPKVASLKGGTQVRVYGNFASTGSYSCRFAAAGTVRVASGVLGCGGDCVTCYTPAWDSAEAAELSVSLNRQQYSLPVDFTFRKELYRFKSAQWILLSCIVFAIVVLFVFVIVWVRHRHFIDGYDKIKEGEVEVDLRDIKMEDRIGRGTFGEVYKGTWRGAVVAVKRLNPMHMNENFVREYEKEVYLMRALRAPNILQFLGSSFNPPDICIVMEYMSRGSLYGILHDSTIAIDWPLLLRMLKDAARGMTYLHSCRPPIIHRDLKSHNLLVDEFWKVKVSDFGLSTVFEQVSQTMTACGTPCWTAPEVLRHQRYTTKADVYSFAVVMWECVTRSDVYVGIPPFKIIYAVSNQGLRPKVPSWVPEPFAKLMMRCWDENMDRRPDFSSILTEIEEMAHFAWVGRPGPDVPLDEHEDSSNGISGGGIESGGVGGTAGGAVTGGGAIASTPQQPFKDECDITRLPVNPKFLAPSSSVIVSSVVPRKTQQGKPRQVVTTQSVVKKKVNKGGNAEKDLEKQPLISPAKDPSPNCAYVDNDNSFFTSSSGSNLFGNSSEFTETSNSILDSNDDSAKDVSFCDNDDENSEYY